MTEYRVILSGSVQHVAVVDNSRSDISEPFCLTQYQPYMPFILSCSIVESFDLLRQNT